MAHVRICIIYSIEGRLICQIADRGPRAEVGYLAYQPPFYAIYYMSSGCDVTAHHYREDCQFPPRGHLVWNTKCDKKSYRLSIAQYAIFEFTVSDLRVHR